MKVLAVDTALAFCSAAIFDSDESRVLAEASEPMVTGHAEAIAPMVRSLMLSASLNFDALHRIATTVGPGTFTGLRIGVSFARGLGLALNLPVTGVSTLRVLAANIVSNPDRLPIAVAIDARRGSVYFQVFDAMLHPLAEPRVTTPAEAATLIPAGRCLAVGSAALPLLAAADASVALIKADAPDAPRAAVIARLASTEIASAQPPQPLYLRRPSAEPQGNRAPVVISEASMDQASLIAALHSRCFAQGWTAPSLADLMRMPGTFVLLASSEGPQPLAFIMARSAADEAEIVSLAVLPHYRRQRLAKRLVHEAASRLAKSGVRWLHIEVAESNAAALALYEKLGFRQSGRRSAYYALADGRREDALIMVRPLPIAPRHD